jgi:hypothetical protein
MHYAFKPDNDEMNCVVILDLVFENTMRDRDPMTARSLLRICPYRSRLTCGVNL